LNYIVDSIGEVVTAMQADSQLIAALTAGIPALNDRGYTTGMPYYMYGHRRELANRLLEKDKDSVFKYQKYPLVALRLDTPEEYADGVVTFTLNVANIFNDPLDAIELIDLKISQNFKC